MEDLRLSKEIIQALLKAKKAIRMYPDNNPIYTKMLDDTFSKFNEFFSYREELALKIKQYEMFFDSEQVYHNPEKEDNFALLFFKDGLRELKFTNGLSKQEMEEFLKIITIDFDKEATDDDIVTLLWEKDFHHVKYIADESFLTEDEEYEEEAIREIKEKAPGSDELLKAYSDAFTAEDVGEVSIVTLTDKDLQMLVKEIDHDMEDKTWKISEILFEMLLHAESTAELEDIFRFIRELLIYSVSHKDLKTFLDILKKVSDTAKDPATKDSIRTQMNLLLSVVNSEETIKYVGGIFDSEIETGEDTLNEYLGFLDKAAIAPFMSILGELKTIRGRKNVINILVHLGSKDIQTLARGLHDSRWYVVRNIIYILRSIGDKRAVEYLLNSAKHTDIRVRKEAIKALGDLKSPVALQTLRGCLSDTDASIRKSAAKALGSTGSETAKKIIIESISEKDFRDRDFDEKKEFYAVLARWNDADVADFLVKTLKKKSFFKRAQTDEDNACAAYCLGLMGRKNAIDELHKFKDSKNKLLRDHVNIAIKRIGHGE